MWICLQTLKQWPPLKTELREGEEIKERIQGCILIFTFEISVKKSVAKDNRKSSFTQISSNSHQVSLLGTWSLSLCLSAGVQFISDSMLIYSPQLFPLYLRAGSREWNEIGIAQKLVVIPLRITTPVLKTTVDFHHFSEKLHSFSALPWCIISNLSDSVSHYIWLWKYYLTISFPERLSN